MKIYENANDQHVRKVVLYEVTSGLAFDEAGTELLTKEQTIDAFLKGCVVENEGNYKIPTGCNVTDTKAELVFGEGGSGGGGMVVTFTFVGEGDFVVDKTPNEVAEALMTGPVVAVVSIPGADSQPLPCCWTDAAMGHDHVKIYFGSHNSETFTPFCLIMGDTSTDEWELAAP